MVDPVQQTPIVDALIARKIDALIIAATDTQAMIEPLRVQTALGGAFSETISRHG